MNEAPPSPWSMLLLLHLSVVLIQSRSPNPPALDILYSGFFHPVNILEILLSVSIIDCRILICFIVYHVAVSEVP